MARIIVFGDIDLFPLYLKINDEKEISVCGKYPKSFTVPADTNHIFATTVSKLERVTSSFSDGGVLSAMASTMQDATNSTLSGDITFGEDDVLLIQVEQRGLKTVIHSKLVPASEVNEYVNMSTVETLSPKKKGKIIKRIALTLGIVILILLIVVFFVFFMKRTGTEPVV